MTLSLVLKTASRRLSAITDLPDQEAQWILARCMSVSHSQLMASLSEVLSEPVLSAFEAMISRRLDGEPLGLVLGDIEFMGHVYDVEPGVLLPRPETELLLQAALELVSEIQGPFYCLELGFGAGVLSIEMAIRCPNATVIAWDINPIAHELALRNAARFQVTGIEWILDDFFSYQHRFDSMMATPHPILVLANPPYISADQYQTLDPSVRDYEPQNALLAHENGLSYYRRLCDSFPADRVMMACEFGIGQEKSLQRCLLAWGARGVVFGVDHKDIPRLFTSTPSHTFLG